MPKKTILENPNKQIRGFVSKDGDVYCPCCDKGLITFLPFGIGKSKRLHALCPNCGALERHRLLWFYLHNKTNFFNDNLKVLHVAPQAILFKRFKALKNLDYVAVDKFPEGQSFPAGMLNMDITNIPINDKSFDVILCLMVLDHIPEDQRAMQELFRVLKPGGWAIIHVPLIRIIDKTREDITIADPKEREKAFGAPDHFRFYSINDYINRLEIAGFNVTVDNFGYTFSKYEMFKYGFPRDGSIYFFRKPVLKIKKKK